MSKSTTTIAPSRKGRNIAAPKPTPAARAPSSPTGDMLLAELKDWHARAMALPFDTFRPGTPEDLVYFQNFNCRAVATMIRWHLEHVEEWGKLSAAPGEEPKAPRELQLMFSFSPGVRLGKGPAAFPPSTKVELRERDTPDPKIEGWDATEMAIILAAKSKAAARRAKREKDAIGRGLYANRAAELSRDTEFCAAWKAKQKKREAASRERFRKWREDNPTGKTPAAKQRTTWGRKLTGRG